MSRSRKYRVKETHKGTINNKKYKIKKTHVIEILDNLDNDIKFNKNNEQNFIEKKFYKTYLKAKSVLTNKKMNQNEYELAHRATTFLAKLLVRINSLQWQRQKYGTPNICCVVYYDPIAEKYIFLYNISGSRKNYENGINNFLEKIKELNQDQEIVEFNNFLKEKNIQASIITSYSSINYNLMVLTTNINNYSCTENFSYIEMNKISQNNPHYSLLGVIDFKLYKNSKSDCIEPRDSCEKCLDKYHIGFYRAQNSIIDKSGKVRCKNPQYMGHEGNIPRRPLSPPRTKKIIDRPINPTPNIIISTREEVINNQTNSISVNSNSKNSSQFNLPLERPNPIFPVLKKVSFALFTLAHSLKQQPYSNDKKCRFTK